MAVSGLGGLDVDNVDQKNIPRGTISTYTCDDIEVIKKFLKDGQMNQVKDIIRSNHWSIDHPIRKELWPLLCVHYGKENFLEGFYEETLEEVLGSHGGTPSSLPSFVDPSYCMNYFLNNAGKKKTMRVMCAIYRTHPEIVYSPLIYPLSSLLMHYMNEERVFYCISNLITSNTKDFISQTRNTHEEIAYVMQKLTKKFAKAAYNQLKNEFKENETMQKVFSKWQWWIFKSLPFQYLVRVMDCFLLDGYKALFRMALAILVSHNKYSGNIKSEFLGGGTSERIVEFCLDIPVPLEKFIKIAYGFRRLSGTVVNQLLLKAQMTIKSRQIKTVRSVSLQCLCTSECTSRLRTSSLDIVIEDM
ncbi:GTPase-activating protein skywalker-like [Centruroides vittatus]|uniref:GTPase-activating protein skywalker-like n=1 Tax=Centruroides vittatus TaxID=120091 RepID=UPI00351083C6